MRQKTRYKMQRNSTAKKLTATIVHAIYDTLLPDTCALCEQILTPASPDHLCPYCRLALPYNLNPCISCGIPLQQTDASHCGPCITAPLVDQAVVPLLHNKEAAYLLHRFKFQKMFASFLFSAFFRFKNCCHQLFVPRLPSWGSQHGLLT